MRWPLVFFCPLILVCVLNSATSQAYTYTISPILHSDGPLFAEDINDVGTIAAWIPPNVTDDAAPTLPGRSFTRTQGFDHELVGLGGGDTHVYRINNLGKSVGISFSGSPAASLPSAIFWTAAGDYTLPLGSVSGQPFGINDTGAVVGQSNGRGFVYSDSAGFVDLTPLLGANAIPFDINNNGQIVGRATVNGDAEGHSAFILDGDHLVDLGLRGGAAVSINDNGVAVGYVPASDRIRAFQYTASDGVQFLDELEFTTRAADINESGVIVGHYEVFPSSNTDEGGDFAFVYEEGTGLRRLQDLLPLGSGWTRLYQATAINNRGQIVGTGVYEGAFRSFVITPVPEPTSVVQFFMALAAVSFSFRASLRLPRRDGALR